MRTHCFKRLLTGATILFMVSSLVSCNKEDIANLQTRMTVLEGTVHQLQDDLKAAMVTGSTILNANQDAQGVWTLTLSDGKVVTITPSSGAGTEVSVEETADAFVITVNGTAYAIPKVASAAINSLVFCPAYADNKVVLAEEAVDVFFLATPALTADQVAAAEFDIADAREVQTRAGAGLFKVDAAALDGDLIKLTVKALAAEAGKLYTVAVKAVLGATAISSNYFFLQVGDDHSFDPEVLVEPVVKDGVQLTKLDGDLDGYHRLLIPNSAAKFIEGFNLKDYFQSLPEGNISFQLAPREDQNENVQRAYDTIAEALSSDGSWMLKRRLGTDCWNSEGKNGIIIYTVANDVIKHKIFWQIDNPVPGMGLDQFLTKDGFPAGEHIEYGSEASVNIKWMIPAGAGVYDLAQIFLKATPEGDGLLNEPLYLRHGQANRALQIIQSASLMKGEDELIGNDGSKFVLGDELKALVKYSRGLVWRTTQPSWASSIRENWSDDEKKAANGPCNGEILGGWDGGGDIPGLMGWEMNEKGLVTKDEYKGWCFRSGVGLFFEYEYGEQTIGPWHWFYMWFNRRVSPLGANDPDAR